MKRLLLAIHDFLSSHRPLALVLLVAMLVTSVFLSLRLHYEEDITEFLPNSSDNEKQVAIYNALADQGRITVIFRPGDEATDDDVMNAIDCFGDRIDSLFSPQTHVEESDAMAAIEEVSHNIALYLTDEDYRRIGHEDELVSNRLFKVAHCVGFLFDKVPLVHDNDDALARFVSHARDLFVLLGNTLCGIYHEQRHVTALHSRNGTDYGESLDVLVYLALAANARSINQYVFSAVLFKRRVYRISGRSGNR